MWLDDPIEAFEIDPDETAVVDNDRAEPLLASVPYLVEFDDVAPLDPERAAGEPDEWDEYPPPPTHVKSAGLAGSLGMHLLPLLILVGLTGSAPAEQGGAIPVNLVLQQPAPEVDAVEAQETQAPPPAEPVAPTPAPPQPVEPPKARQAAAVPPPSPKPKPAPVAPQRAATASAQPTAVSVTQQVQAMPPPQPAVPAGLNSTGPYLAYLVTLTRQHLDMLPESFVAGRRGKTVIAVRVLDDGTIAQTRVAASSDYPDVDSRIQEMVVAVRRFPPLPEALRGQGIELNLNLNFPDVFKQ